MENVEFNYWRM